ncbi:hypothetical protein AB0K48_14790, partial [Nonomuraea sp. NPDC055795]
LFAVVLNVRMSRQLEMTIGHRNLHRRRGPLARPEEVDLAWCVEVGKSLPADWQRPRTLVSE